MATRKPTKRRVTRRESAPRGRDGAPARRESAAAPRVRGEIPAAATAADVYAALDGLAPFSLAAEWDNVGLLAGRMDWPARRTLLAIDLTDAVAQEALAGDVGLVVAYHPPIFKGIRAVTAAAEAPTTLLPDLLAARASIIALHTALDAAAGGTNDALLDAFELTARRPLEPVLRRSQRFKLVAFVPDADVARVRDALSAAGAGVIGHYSECSFEVPGRGSFRGDETTQPAVGQKQSLEFVEESRLEMVVSKARLAAAVRALYATHSYEEPAFDVYPIEDVAGRGAVGMGRVGTLAAPTRGRALVEALAKAADVSAARAVGDLKRPFESVTAAAGSFGVASLTDPTSLVITGELKHHDALVLQRRGVCAVCLGHYASERPVLDVLRRKLAERVAGLDVRISRADGDPLERVKLE